MVKMRILHISDSHGMPKQAPSDEFDVVACTGDFLPSCPGKGACPPRHLEEPFQRDWLRLNASDIARYVGGRPFIWVAGNHDWIDPCDALRAAGVDVIDANMQIVDVVGLRWAGFPYVPHINGMMTNELSSRDMFHACYTLVKTWELDSRLQPDVLLAHCPLFGTLDRAHDGNHYGNATMLEMLSQSDARQRPRFYLCGHVHSPAGPVQVLGMTVYNSATEPRIIEV